MEKTKYRYKCMICGTEVVSADDVLSCSACGSDELAKFEIAPVIDVVEKKPPRKQPRRRKPTSSLTSDVDILSIIKDLDSALPMPKSIPPYRWTSIHISTPASPPSGIGVKPPPSGVCVKPPPPTKWERICGCMAKVPWRVLLRITVPLAIGGVIYGIVKSFI